MRTIPEENRFKQRYQATDTPGDIGEPDLNLIHAGTGLSLMGAIGCVVFAACPYAMA